MRKKRARYYNARCGGCGNNRPIANLSMELCANCTSFTYRMAAKLVEQGGTYLNWYHARYVDQPQHRYRMLIDTGVVHDKADAKCARDGMRKRFRAHRRRKIA